MDSLFKPMTLEDKYFLDQITRKINNPMKLFHVEWTHFNVSTQHHELHNATMDAKDFAEFIINTAFDKNFFIRQVKEI